MQEGLLWRFAECNYFFWELYEGRYGGPLFRAVAHVRVVLHPLLQPLHRIHVL